MPSAHSPSQNKLLAALPAADFEPLVPHLELVPLVLGAMLYEPGQQLQHAYFPTTAIVSLHYVTASGASAEAAGVGQEGVVGVSLFMGGDTTPSSALVQTAGHAYRLERRWLMQEFIRAGLLQRLLLRYPQALITQTSQTAVCNRHHSVEQQLSRWPAVATSRCWIGAKWIPRRRPARRRSWPVPRLPGLPWLRWPGSWGPRSERSRHRSNHLPA